MKNLYALQLSNFYPTANLPQAIASLLSYVFTDEEINKNIILKKVFWENETVNEIVINVTNPDIIIASCYIWNWERTYSAIAILKERFPNCLIIIGGPQPKHEKIWASQHPEIDIIVTYYGEITLLNILKHYINNKTLRNIPGILTKDYKNPNNQKQLNLNDIPSPYLNGFFDKLISEAKSKEIRAIFESNRGCPYSCSFCDIGAKEYRKINRFKLERCLKELEWMIKNNIRAIDVADANFGILPRDEEIIDHLIALKNKYQWNGRFLPTWSKSNSNRVQRLATKLLTNGLDSIFGLSLQSLNETTLKNINRVNPYNLAELSAINKSMNNNNIHTYTEIIFPLPGDNLSNYTEGISSLLDIDHTFDKFQVNQLSYISNSELSSSDNTYKINWKDINGFTRHYFGENNNDIIAISNAGISESETFECLFNSKSFIIPLYFYGLIRGFVDYLHWNNIKNRSSTLNEIYKLLHQEKSFLTFKEEMKEHYFSALYKKTPFGFMLSQQESVFFPEYAFAHQYYLFSDLYDKLVFWYPEYEELINFDKVSMWINKAEKFNITFSKYNKGTWSISESREYNNFSYLENLYIIGRFDRRWRKESITLIK